MLLLINIDVFYIVKVQGINDKDIHDCLQCLGNFSRFRLMSIVKGWNLVSLGQGILQCP